MNKSEVIKEIALATGVEVLDLPGVSLTPEQARAYEELSLASVLDKPVSNFKIPVGAVILACTKKDL